MSAHTRRGFALLAVLWLVAGLSALALGVSLAARQAVAAAHNRNDLTRAQWRAEECAEQARAVIAGALPAPGWLSLDRVVAKAAAPNSDCTVALRAAGSRLNVNGGYDEAIRALLERSGIIGSLRDSLMDALADWRDADDVPRPFGAEADWYARHRSMAPRNGPLASILELHRVRGFERLLALDSVLDVEPARVALDQASLAVIAALPGFGEEAVARVAELRQRGVSVGELIPFAGQLSPGARLSLLARYQDLVGRTTVEPDAWILTSRAVAGHPPATAVLELLLVRSGDRAAIVRRRTWIE